MKRLHLMMIAASFAAGCASTSSIEEGNISTKGENCALQIPPKDAFPRFDNARFNYIYPKIIPNNYTGCQIEWQEDGSIYTVTRFERGDPVHYDANYYKDKSPVLCRLRKQTTRPPFSMCPSYEGVMVGVKKIAEEEPFGGEVPPERDPRGKGILPIPDYVIQDLSLVADRLKDENCAMQIPPKDANAYFIPEDNFTFMYPTTISADYTGCQVIWTKEYGRNLVLHFDRGTPDIIIKYIDDKLSKGCKIKDLKIDNEFYCPYYRLFKSLAEEEPYKGDIPKKLDRRR